MTDKWEKWWQYHSGISGMRQERENEEMKEITAKWDCFSEMTPKLHTWYLSFFYTNTFWGLKILHSKVRKFTTKKASRQNSVKPHTLCKITHSMCNHTLCVKLHTVCKITHCVWNSTYSTRFHRGSFRVKYGKNSSHFKIFTPTLLVALATNMRYVNARVG